jgi:hypothetical protein
MIWITTSLSQSLVSMTVRSTPATTVSTHAHPRSAPVSEPTVSLCHPVVPASKWTVKPAIVPSPRHLQHIHIRPSGQPNVGYTPSRRMLPQSSSFLICLIYLRTPLPMSRIILCISSYRISILRDLGDTWGEPLFSSVGTRLFPEAFQSGLPGEFLPPTLLHPASRQIQTSAVNGG